MTNKAGKSVFKIRLLALGGLGLLGMQSANAVTAQEYAALQHYAQQLNPAAASTATLVPGERPLRRGMQGEDVKLAKQRLTELGFPLPLDAQFGPELDATLREFQLGLSMKEDGVLDKQTRFNLNLTDAKRAALLQWQLPQMYTLLQHAPERYVVINIPAYTLTAYQGGQQVLSSRIVIGKTDRETPLLATQIAAIKYNPNWSVPPVVIKHDLQQGGKLNLAKIQKHKLRMLDADGNAVDPATVSAEGGLGRYRFVQDPGANNALGRLKFELTASNGIYLHDTPSKGLFGRENRAASSGCVRVQQWQQLAAWVLGVNAGTIGQRVASKKTYSEAVAAPVKVYFVYWPAQLEGEKVRWYADIYQQYQTSRGINAALKLLDNPAPSAIGQVATAPKP
ncbi:L,D-transpeptidase family protein [Chitinibacter tainanensis]|uniref:L,D-transpeptidase family protein n=1 Tax=Chitinibacter tainanensis TaxID=230667 RepID=UPI00146F96FD|nr:L,D-transpeptidase family protein [Chitinibacter tainanensis]